MQFCDCLFAPSDYNDVVEEIFTVLFSAFSSLLTHLVAEHLPDGNMILEINLLLKKQCPLLRRTQSARGINHFLTEKPNASILSLEAMILDQVLSLHLLLDIEQGDLEFVTYLIAV